MKRRPILFLFLAWTLSWAAVPAAAQPPAVPAPALAPGDPMPTDPAITRGRLPNGLSYYVLANKKPEKRAELRLVVKAGSILEEDDQQGLAHFVEHMAFNGTKHFPKHEIVSFLESLGMRFGADVNASTSFDETVFTLTVPTDKPGILDRSLLILEDWAHNVTLRPGRDRQGARRRDRGVARPPRRRRAPAGSDAPDHLPGIALRRPRADRQDRRAPDVQARAPQAVLLGLVPPGPDGRRRRRGLRQPGRSSA